MKCVYFLVISTLLMKTDTQSSDNRKKTAQIQDQGETMQPQSATAQPAANQPPLSLNNWVESSSSTQNSTNAAAAASIKNNDKQKQKRQRVQRSNSFPDYRYVPNRG